MKCNTNSPITQRTSIAKTAQRKFSLILLERLDWTHWFTNSKDRRIYKSGKSSNSSYSIDFNTGPYPFNVYSLSLCLSWTAMLRKQRQTSLPLSWLVVSRYPAYLYSLSLLSLSSMLINYRDYDNLNCLLHLCSKHIYTTSWLFHTLLSYQKKNYIITTPGAYIICISANLYFFTNLSSIRQFELLMP